MLPFPFYSYIFLCLSLFFSFLAIFVNFLSAFSNEITILVLIFLSCFLRGSEFSRKLISLLHELVHLLRLYYSLIYIYVCTWFALVVCALTILHSMLLNYGNVVFLLFTIPFKFSRLNFCSCDIVCSRLCGCAVFRCVGFHFPKLVVHFGWVVCVCLYLMGQVLYYYLVDYLFSGVILLFHGQKTNLSVLLFWLDLQVSD